MLFLYLFNVFFHHYDISGIVNYIIAKALFTTDFLFYSMSFLKMSSTYHVVAAAAAAAALLSVATLLISH